MNPTDLWSSSAQVQSSAADIGQVVHCDILVIGTGMGGATIARALAGSQARVLLVEQGDFLPRERENWSPADVFERGRYKNAAPWTDSAGRPFQPGVYHYVGGSTKMFGACLPRFREEDFTAVEHWEGSSPAWPFSYADLEPHYTVAEQWYQVHGSPGEDPTEPQRSQPYPFPALPHEPYVAHLRERLLQQNLHPYALAMGVDRRPGGTCIRCRTCDGFPCMVGAKSDAEMCAVRPALAQDNVRLLTGTRVVRLDTDHAGGRVVRAQAERNGATLELRAGTFVVSCGAVASAALLLSSESSAHPQGLANSSGLVGRGYMQHNNTALLAVDLHRSNPTWFQKTLGVNDYYRPGPTTSYPLGNLQLLGKLQASMLKAARPRVPRPLLDAVSSRSVEWWVMSEDLPDDRNRIVLGPTGRPQVHWQPTNTRAHRELITRARQMMRRAGYQLVATETLGVETDSHQCGTLRAGEDPARSVLDPYCRTHDVRNLFVVDASFFPSSAAMNPALTVAAQAIRVAREGEVLP
ncbi:choline dehydrogenase-like flavoprotein [Streptomyces sp. SLBN-118]|uniref:GMC oxidoreductase n=1 Tax=Streptomyces sp. SLBN-118 TaxID=2768454 RepID=UPI0011518085|nr:GMC family oxidoreductase [Streptomyces sp. SLBN-118]TQK51251.1 choline dehydrogenase-like flavoprotein [Streptomyces sp. SLBN-118]